MGKKRNTNKVSLALPLTTITSGKAASVCGREAGRENMSDISDLESTYSASAVGADFGETDDENDVSNLVDSFADLVENAQDKKIEIRLKAIDNMLLVLNKNFMADQVEKWRGTVVDIIERNLKRTPEEAIRACTLAALFSVQMGVDFEDEICGVAGTLRQICADESAIEAVRSSCAQALGICFYLSVESQGHRLECLQTLKAVWSGMKTTKVAGTSLFSSALGAWALLVERCDPGYVLGQVEEFQPKICTYLDSATVEARISAGEALAILHEIGIKNIDDNFQFRNQHHLIGLLSEMSIDSAKNHAKRDKKLQKMTFRQISDAICNQNWPKLCVRFNKREQLEIEGCHAKLLYDSLRQLLRNDLNAQLTNNEVLRELFDLGPVLEAEEPATRQNKAHKNERLIQFGEQKKQMNINRSKGRAKKNDHKHDFGGD